MPSGGHRTDALMLLNILELSELVTRMPFLEWLWLASGLCIGLWLSSVSVFANPSKQDADCSTPRILYARSLDLLAVQQLLLTVITFGWKRSRGQLTRTWA